MSFFTRRSTGRITPTRKLVKKGSSLRDLRPLTERVELEKVLGLTVSGSSGLACNPVSGNIAYTAGCVIVLVGSPAQVQTHIVNSSRKTVSSLAFSPDGKFLVSGESGHQPAVRVWDAEDNTHPKVSEMAKGHKHGIQCVAFSPNMKYVVSVGFQHDMLVNIWNWREGTTIACNKVSSKVNAISFSEKGDYFVTVGVRLVKFWYVDSESSAQTKVKKKLPLLGRPAILGEKRNNQFIDVACGIGTNSSVTYCVTKSGLLCSFNEKRLLDKWVELRVNGAYSLTVNEQLIFCGCSDGIIRAFSSSSLQFIGTLPKPHCLGVDVAAGLDPSHLLTKVENAVYPDTVAITFDHQNTKLTCVYNDHSIYTWDINDMKKIGKVSSSLYHNSCIWGVEVYPEVTGNYQPSLPFGSFLTCSYDGTVRVWNIETDTNLVTHKNIYSKDLMRILYSEKDLTCLKDTKSHSETNRKESETKPGVRCLKLCPVGQQLATGDRMGYIRVLDLTFMDVIIKIEAHESEVLCIEFSTSNSGRKLLGSAGRDRLIHVFDCDNDYSLVQTIDDHSASITSVKFNVSESKDFQLISCAADKSVIFRSAQKDPELQFSRYTNVATKTTFYDMDVHPSRKYAVTAGHDRNLRVYDISSGKQIRSFKGSMGDDGFILKVLLDRSGFYAATSCSDKSLSLYDFEMGECVAGMVGHSEIVTGMQFSVDCKRLITVSGDGCIFVWKLPSAFAQNMSERLADQVDAREEIVSPETSPRPETFTMKSESHITTLLNGEDFKPATTSILFENGNSSPPDDDYRFSIGKLPSWAKKQIANHENMPDSEVLSKTVQSSTTITAPLQPAGKWAERFGQTNLKIQADSPNTSLEETPERKHLTIEPNSLHSHIQALARTPLESRCSNGSLDEEMHFFQDAKAALQSMEEDEDSLQNKVEDMHSNVTTSRGSDVYIKSIETGTTCVDSSQDTTEQEINRDEEKKEEEQDIIYYPTEEDLDSDVASKPSRQTSQSNQPEEVLNIVKTTAFNPNSNSIKQTECSNQDYRVPLRKRTLEDILRSPSDSDDIGYFEIRPGHSMDNLIIHEVEFTSSGSRRSSEELLALQGTPYDVKIRQDSDEDKDLESLNTESTSRDDGDEKTGDSISDDEDLFTKEIIPKWDELPEEPAPTLDKAEAEDHKEFLMENFECLGSTPTLEKEEFEFKSGEEALPDQPLPFDRNNFHRTSISARFILRSKQSSVRSSADATSQISASLEQKNIELEKRKEELALTKKRLEALGFQTKDKRRKAENSDESKVGRLVKTEMEVVEEVKEHQTPKSSPQKSSVNAQKTGNETLGLPSTSTPNDQSITTTHRVSRLPSPEPAPGPLRVLSPGVPSSPPSQSSIASSVEDTRVESIACHNSSSPIGSPKHSSSYKIVKSPKGTIISCLDITKVLHSPDAEKSPIIDNEISRTSSHDPPLSHETSELKIRTDGETSPVKRASELIAFFEPPANQTKKPVTLELTDKKQDKTSELRPQDKSGKKNAKVVMSCAEVSKSSRPAAKVPLLSKTREKNAPRTRRSFPANATRVATKRKEAERKIAKGGGGDLAKAKSCGDLLSEQTKEQACELRRTRERAESESHEQAKTVVLGLSHEEESASNLLGDAHVSQNNTNVTDLSELSAELTAALAKPSPEPIQINLSRNYLLDGIDNGTPCSHRRQAAHGKDRGFSGNVTTSDCREVVVDLVRAFERALECHSKILCGEIEDDQQQGLSMLSATFSTIQETVIECKKDREQKTRSPRAKILELKHEPFISQNTKKMKEVAQQTEHNCLHLEQEMIPLLEKYSKLLLEKLDKKINPS